MRFTALMLDCCPFNRGGPSLLSLTDGGETLTSGINEQSRGLPEGSLRGIVSRPFG